MIRILLPIFIMISFGFADIPPIKTYKTINECQSDIYFGNGIMTTYDEAQNALDETLKPAILHDIYHGDEAKMKNMHHFGVAYNYSFKEKFGDTAPAMLLDLVESYGQLTNTSKAWWIVEKAKDALVDLALGHVDVVGKYGVKKISKVFMKYGLDKWIADWLAEQIVDTDKELIKKMLADLTGTSVEAHHDHDLSRMVDQYKASIRAGHGVIIVSHSQGNLFAIEAVDKLDGWMKNYAYQISIASPATKFATKQHWLVSLDNDPVAKTPGSVGINTRNYARYFTYDIGIDTIDGHENDTCALQAKLNVYNMVSEGFWLDGSKPKQETYQDDCNGISYTATATPDEWSWWQIKFHAFDFYMGKTVYPLHISKEQVIMYESRKDPKTEGYKSQTHTKIIEGIEGAIETHNKNKSQYKIKKRLGCLCKDKYVKMEHQFGDVNLTRQIAKHKIKNFAGEGNGKIYTVGEKWVRATCGGTKIREVNEGKTCLILNDDKDTALGEISGNIMPPTTPSGLFTAQMHWHETQVHMELSNSLMGESVSGCGMAAIGSGDLSLYSVYPGTYPVNATAKGYEELKDKNISDTVTLDIRAVSANSRDSVTVTNAYQYAHLGKNGHLADIVITRPDPAKPPVYEAIPTVKPISVGRTKRKIYGSSMPYSGPKIIPSTIHSSQSHGYYSGSSTHAPSVYHETPLCNDSCGCLPCEYKILSYLNQARLGPISGAKVILYKATEEEKPDRRILYEGTTSISDEIDKAGVISLPVPYPEQKELSAKEQAFMDAIKDYDGDFILELSGGFDIDSDDDLVVDSRYTHLAGKLHLIMDKKSLLNNDYKVNILTEIAYQLSKDLLGESYDKERLKKRLDDIAKRVLIEKLYPVAEEPLGRKDLFYWIPSAHKNWLIKPYEQLSHIVEKVYKGEDIYDDSYHFVYDEISKEDKKEMSPEPILTSQWIEVSEGVEGSIDIGEVTPISEGNSSIMSYHISGDGSELFAIDNSGTISLKEGKSLDFEKKKLYELKLTAKNSNAESRPVTLYIVVKNVVDSPEDRSFDGGVFPEDAKPGDQVGFIHFDAGTSPIEKIEIGSEDKDAFEVSLDGNITLSDQAHFDYETKNYAKITLQAFNKEGKSRIVPIIFTITDAVDVPIVKMLDVHLREGAIYGQVVGQMNILSNDPILEIKLTGNGSENFNISKSGLITVADGANIDYESVANYVLKVQARNIQGWSREGILVIRVDDALDIPELENSTLHMSEFSPIGTVVGKVKVRTSGKYPIESYTLNDTSNFSIDSSGTIRVANDMLSHSDQQYFNLRVYATNKEGRSSTVTVVVYVDTKRPILGVLDSYVYENATVGTKIGKVPSVENALMIESARLEGEGSENFTINSNLEISVADGAQLDYEGKTNYTLKAFATNSAGESDATTVYIRVLDRDDTIKISGFSTTIYEDTKPGDTIGLIKTISTGGMSINHYTLSGDGSQNFVIESDGTVKIANGALLNRKKYPNYHLLLTASDNNGHISNSAYLDISVVKSANTPIAISQSITLEEDTRKDIRLNATDADGDPLTYRVVTMPQHGTYRDGIYTPAKNYNGADSFTFIANDEKFDSDVATISINITPVNDKPIAKDQNITLDEDHTKAISLIGSDIDGDRLTYTVTKPPIHGVYANGIYRPNANYFGADNIVYKVNDGTVDSELATVKITINPVNDKPVAFSQHISLNEDSKKAFKMNATDVEGDPLTYRVATPPKHGTFNDGVYIPFKNYNGSDDFTFVANDGQVDSAPATVSVIVTPVNDKPIVTSQKVTLDEDHEKAIKLLASDIDGDKLIFNIVKAPIHGAYANGIYRPNANYFGSDKIVYKVNDGTVDSDFATVEITINSVNDKPVAFDQNITLDEDTQKAVKLNATDIEGDPLTYRIITPPQHGIFKNKYGIYVPNENYNGSDNFTFVANDGQDDSLPASVSVYIKPINDAPLIEVTNARIQKNESYSPIYHVEDIDGQIVSEVWKEGNNTLIFPKDDFTSGVHTLTLTVTDNDGAKSVANLILRVEKIHGCKPLPKTGQTIIYADYDDGYYQKGSEVEPRFERDDALEIVKDKVTGLSWQDNSETMTVKKTWQEAMEYCQNLTLGDFTDWRLPTVEELVYIVDKESIEPAINPVFENVQSSGYWSSSTFTPTYKYLIWTVDLRIGGNTITHMKDSMYLRCVRKW